MNLIKVQQDTLIIENCLKRNAFLCINENLHTPKVFLFGFMIGYELFSCVFTWGGKVLFGFLKSSLFHQ